MVKIVRNLVDLRREIARRSITIDSIPIDALFTDRFMRRNTDSHDIDTFLERCGHGGCSTQIQFDLLDDDTMDSMVKLHSKFKTWNDMKVRALKEYARRHPSLE